MSAGIRSFLRVQERTKEGHPQGRRVFPYQQRQNGHGLSASRNPCFFRSVAVSSARLQAGRVAQ